MIQSTFAKLIGCTLFLLVCSCNGQKGARSVDEIAREIVITQPDTSIVGMLQGNKDDSLLFFVDLSDEQIAVDCREALDDGRFSGSVTEGNRYAMVIDPVTHRASHVLNLTELSGQWFYDETNNRGLTFTVAGALSSINPDAYCFKKWKFHNGRIILYYVNKDEVIRESRDYHSDTTEIEKLTADELMFRFKGETLRCVRKKEAIKLQLKF